jgi:dipeptidyl aminopeptidase/acylaminoacyl peptidase
MMYDVAFSFRMQEMAANGYVLLYVNPRGSTGYGGAFANAIDNAYSGPDVDDLMRGVDVMVKRPYIDARRLYVTGCSGGGLLTNWLVGHTTRFAAAAALCSISNWTSFAGTGDTKLWPYSTIRPAIWEDARHWLELSPVVYAGKVRTPTLLMTGENDLRTPPGQAEEFYAALKLNKVPTRLVLLKNQNHGWPTIPSNFMRTQLYLRKWFEQWTHPDDLRDASWK